MIRLEGTIMAIKAHLSSVELETRYKTAVDPVGKSHFHALWLLSSGYEVDEVAEILSFSARWVRALIKRYNEGGAQPPALGRSRLWRSCRSTKPASGGTDREHRLCWESAEK
jgi:hypothetical protein